MAKLLGLLSVPVFFVILTIAAAKIGDVTFPAIYYVMAFLAVAVYSLITFGFSRNIIALAILSLAFGFLFTFAYFKWLMPQNIPLSVSNIIKIQDSLRAWSIIISIIFFVSAGISSFLFGGAKKDAGFLEKVKPQKLVD